MSFQSLCGLQLRKWAVDTRPCMPIWNQSVGCSSCPVPTPRWMKFVLACRNVAGGSEYKELKWYVDIYYMRTQPWSGFVLHIQTNCYIKWFPDICFDWDEPCLRFANHSKLCINVAHSAFRKFVETGSFKRRLHLFLAIGIGWDGLNVAGCYQTLPYNTSS